VGREEDGEKKRVPRKKGKEKREKESWSQSN